MWFLISVLAALASLVEGFHGGATLRASGAVVTEHHAVMHARPLSGSGPVGTSMK